MASIVYNSFIEDVNNGVVVPGSDTFYAFLVTDAYTANKDLHERRADVVGEATGDGYTPGGKQVAVTVTRDDVNDRTDIVFENVAWASSTITARGAVIYKRRGGAATADELVTYVDFGSNKSSTLGTFALSFTGPLRYQNLSA